MYVNNVYIYNTTILNVLTYLLYVLLIYYHNNFSYYEVTMNYCATINMCKLCYYV